MENEVHPKGFDVVSMTGGVSKLSCGLFWPFSLQLICCESEYKMNAYRNEYIESSITS